MNYHIFNSVCPFEIGDHVRLRSASKIYSTKETLIINDILTVSSCKDKTTVFKIRLYDQYDNELLDRSVDDLMLIKK